MSEFVFRGPKAPRPRPTLAATLLLACLLSLPFAVIAALQAVL